MRPDGVRIVIPARDEEEHLDRCLEALRDAVRRIIPELHPRVVMVLDKCCDRSVEIVERWQGRWPAGGALEILELSAGNVGVARRAGFEQALDGLNPRRRRRTWLATSDADSSVPSHWLARQLTVLANGERAWAGTVRLDEWTISPAQRPVWTRYNICAGPGHKHVHGANMGCDAETYCEAGGFAPLPTGEDHALHAAIRDLGIRPVQDSGTPVTTSARVLGRAPDGFAADLGTIPPRETSEDPKTTTDRRTETCPT